MRIKGMLGALALLFLCSAVHADELVYDYSEATYLGTVPVIGTTTTDVLAAAVYGTPADFGLGDEWLADLPEVLNALGISLSLAESNLYSVDRELTACPSGTVAPCDVFRANIFYPTDLPAGLSTSGTLTVDTTATPEPGTWLLMLTGLGAVIYLSRRKTRHPTVENLPRL